MDSDDDDIAVDSSEEKSEDSADEEEKNKDKDKQESINKSGKKDESQTQIIQPPLKKLDINPDQLEDKDKRSIFANNLNYDMVDEEITNFFSQFGIILDIDVPRNEYGNLNKGRAFIEYQTSADA